jgi:hypothetical protein
LLVQIEKFCNPNCWSATKQVLEFDERRTLERWCPMSTLSRRKFLYAGGAAAGVAAASAAALATPGGHMMASSPGRAEAAAPEAEVWEPEGVDQLVLYVRNTGSGEVTVLTDGHEVVFHDAQLVARVQRAAKTASV